MTAADFGPPPDDQTERKHVIDSAHAKERKPHRRRTPKRQSLECDNQPRREGRDLDAAENDGKRPERIACNLFEEK